MNFCLHASQHLHLYAALLAQSMHQWTHNAIQYEFEMGIKSLFGQQAIQKVASIQTQFALTNRAIQFISDEISII